MYREETLWDGKIIQTLKDILPVPMKVLFVGLNPSPVSVKAGHYHQGRLGKKFWGRVIKYKIMEGVIEGREDERLSTYGYGITDIAKKPTSRAKDLTENDYNLGQVILREKIRSYNPKVVAFIYKKAAEKLLGRSFRNQFGLLQERIENAKVFLFPAPYAPEKDESKYMTDLKRLIDSIGQ